MSDYEGKIAVIGLAGRFPEADSPEALWLNLMASRESVRPLDPVVMQMAGTDPAICDKPNYVNAFGWLEDVDKFDAEFFSMSPREAQVRDPQHRLLLECCYWALENAGYSADKFSGDIALFAGTGSSGYLYKNLMPNQELVATFGAHALVIANEKDYASTFVSYKLNLTGASVNVNTSCSSSLVAIHYGMQSLLNFEADMVLAGGAAINSDQDIGYFYVEGGIHPPSGHIRPFDREALGTIGGSGGGMLLLKRLKDAVSAGDHIHAVLLASAVNNDGAHKIGYTAPSVDGQAKVITEALQVAGLSAEDISYVETHGTGTALGDPIEVEALTRAFRKTSSRHSYCPIGSVKSNIGHLGAASGVAGLIKVIESMRHRQLAPSLNFVAANPEIDFAATPFYVNASLQPWTGQGPVRAGVSSFGIGGTNAHLIVESAPPTGSTACSGPQLLKLSAKSAWSLQQSQDRLASFIGQHPEFSLADIAYTLEQGRAEFNWRCAVVAHDQTLASSLFAGAVPCQLEQATPGAVVWMFPGQGSQYAGMTRQLYLQEPRFRTVVDQCCDWVQIDAGLELRAFILQQTALDPDQTQYAQPLLFITEYAYSRLLQLYTGQADGYIGHSIGEYVAACLAGVFSLRDALKLVCARGSLMAQAPHGAMLAVRCGVNVIAAQVQEAGLDVAAINSVEHCVLAGPVSAIEQFAAALQSKQIPHRLLRTGHAFHSAAMEPLLPAFRTLLDGILLAAPKQPFISNLTGQWISAEQAQNPEYWLQHLRQTVQFAAGIDTLVQHGYRHFVEVGPGTVLTALTNRQLAGRNLPLAVALGRHIEDEQSDQQVFLQGLAQLWCQGLSISSFPQDGSPAQRVPLPPYPFERKRHWILPPDREEPAAIQPDLIMAVAGSEQELLSQLQQIWQTCFGTGQIRPHDNFYQLGGDSLLATRLVARINQQFDCQLGLVEFMRHPTISGMQLWLQQKTAVDAERVTGEI
jgi:acyl transferase domain-containing protein